MVHVFLAPSAPSPSQGPVVSPLGPPTAHASSSSRMELSGAEASPLHPVFPALNVMSSAQKKT